ncbi:MAG: PQQ-binding-like beta-propeller repeat protein [Planctomycetaceae bacterium]
MAFVAGSLGTQATYGQEAEADAHPLGLELQVLARDLTDGDYHAVLETMIPTDLAAEWLRVGTPDNHVTFLEAHGGMEKVQADPQLKAAYEERRRIADTFLELMRAAYKKRGQRPPFDDEQLQKLLAGARKNQKAADAALNVAVRVIMPAAGAEAHWPRFRGPTGQGNVTGTSFPRTWGASENIVWKTKIAGRGNSSPVIWGERIFVTAASEDGTERSLLCYARSDGRLLWQKTASAPATIEQLYWKNTYASSTPVTDGERVIVFFGSSGLFCYDLDGHLLWKQDLGEFVTMHGPGTSPVIYKDLVIFVQYQNRGDSVFAAFETKTGKPRWRLKPDNQMCWSTPVVLRVGVRDELVYNGSNRVVGYSPDTGNQIWSVAGSTHEAIPTIVVGGGLIFSASGRNGSILAIRPGGSGDVTATHVLWNNPRGGPHVTSPVYYDRKLFLVSDTGVASCLDAMTGATIWQKRLRGRFSTSPLEIGGILLLTNEDGRCFILRAGDKFELIAENDLAENTLATPAILDGRIYFRTAENLICIGDGATAEKSEN